MLAALEEYNRIASSPEFNAIKAYLSSHEFSQIQKNIEQISKIASRFKNRFGES